MGRALTRDEVFARDGYRCVYCGEVFPIEELSLDHVQASSRGGDRSGGNLVTACRACNVLKGRQRLSAFLSENPKALANFREHARFVWPRHIRALEEELRSRQQG